jgi:hypothetical protein
MISHIVFGQEIKLSKSIDRSFAVSDGLNIEITNKYGSVIIDTWDQNEVALKIEILAYGKDESSAEGLMERVEFDFKYTNDFLGIESVFDRKKSFFRDLMYAVGDYSASLLSKHKLQINYELTIPESIGAVSIDNKFGDVHLGDVEGKVDLTIAHGDLRGSNFNDFSSLHASYGKVRIKKINEADVSLKGAELDVEFAGKLNLSTSSSSVTIGEVLVVDLESTNDEIQIASVRDISGSANFSDISISYLTETCRIDQNYGSMHVKHLQGSFRSMKLHGKSTDYRITISDAANFDSKIYARDDKLTIRDFPGKREKRFMDDNSKFVQVSGIFGLTASESTLQIDAQKGEVFIDFEETPVDAHNK